MSRLSDREIKYNMFADDTYAIAGLEDSSMQFCDAQWLYLTDQNQGNYSSGIINFDTITLANKWVDYYNSYLLIPLAIYSSTANALTPNSQVAIKASLLSLIYGITNNVNNLS